MPAGKYPLTLYWMCHYVVGRIIFKIVVVILVLRCFLHYLFEARTVIQDVLWIWETLLAWQLLYNYGFLIFFSCSFIYSDLADWLGVGEVGLFNFKPSVRPVPLEVHIQASGYGAFLDFFSLFSLSIMVNKFHLVKIIFL